MYCKKALYSKQGVLHYTPFNTDDQAYLNILRKRGMRVDPAAVQQHQIGQALGQSQLAKSWEDVTDLAVNPLPANELLKYGDEGESLSGDDISQLSQLPANAAVNSFKGIGPLGFSHLVDELRNATRADTDLPPQLRLDPAKLERVTVPQAVQLVSKINAWRAKNAEAADLALATNPTTHLVKSYDTVPGTQAPNAAGLRWVELRQPAGA